MHTIRTAPTSPPARRALAFLLALLLGLSMIPLAAFAGPSAEPYAIPEPPSNIQARDTNYGIEISWDPAAQANSYILYKGDSLTGPWREIAHPERSPYTNADAQPGKTYFYRLSTFWNEEASDMSAVASAMIPDPSPSAQTYPLIYTCDYPDGSDSLTSIAGQFASGTPVTLSDITSVDPDGEDWSNPNFKFMGWLNSSDGTVYNPGTTLPMQEPFLLLSAAWDSPFGITYDGNGADGGIVPVDNGMYFSRDLVHIPLDTPTKTGYTFVGWKNRADGAVHQPNEDFPITRGGAYLVALWAERADAGKNTLVLDDDDLTAGDAVWFTATGDRQSETGSTGGEARFVPVSWTIESNFHDLPFSPDAPYRGSAIIDEPGSYIVTATYVEQFFNICCDSWEPTGNTATLSKPFTVKARTYELSYFRNYTPEDAFVAPGGAFAAGDTVALSSIDSVGVTQDDYTREGYRFMGWNTDRTADWSVTGNFAMPNGKTDLYAIWAPTCAVVYDGNGHDGGTVPVNEFAYVKGDAVTVASDEPTRAGYKFAGWTADHDGKVYRAGEKFAMPEGGARLVAKWTPQAAPGPNNNQAAKPSVPKALSKAGFLPKTGDEAVPFVALGALAAAGALGVRSLRRKKQE
ncbi:hypothetical protein C1878_05605 [Gordonibacter sp. 28C]|uniref:InlB B-repeat-containing protein n=1 Tax=Gordonibacter sp. 28C TaxID=2078569 RepID=UPI000DF8699E|nr:InlB B-repeat-containing protein [Gordonibacter sp. 28C]RDB63332.1 hypothetical protein C1878_05605 [Gordonibacter sp. 28C]